MLGYTRGVYINITTARPVLSVAARSNFVGCVPCSISSVRFVRQPLRFVRQPNCRLVKADSPNIQTRVDLVTCRDNDWCMHMLSESETGHGRINRANQNSKPRLDYVKGHKEENKIKGHRSRC
jgi:hypothetical protein